jgi:hypothetical protein
MSDDGRAFEVRVALDEKARVVGRAGLRAVIGEVDGMRPSAACLQLAGQPIPADSRSSGAVDQDEVYFRLSEPSQQFACSGEPRRVERVRVPLGVASECDQLRRSKPAQVVMRRRLR